MALESFDFFENFFNFILIFSFGISALAPHDYLKTSSDAQVRKLFGTPSAVAHDPST